MAIEEKTYFLNRSRLRDVVLLCAFASGAFGRVTGVMIGVGFFLLALGCFLHLVAKGILIRNIVLCDRGLYGVVRHPYYLANYLIDWSFCVLSGNYLLVLAYPFAFFWSYGPTMRKEEGLLASSFGTDFGRYASETPQVFPDRSTIKRFRNLFDGFSARRVTPKEYGRVARFCSAGVLIALFDKVAANGLSLAWQYKITHVALPGFGIPLLAAALLYVASLILIKLDGRRNARH